jgi:hypothetical protein
LIPDGSRAYILLLSPSVKCKMLEQFIVSLDWTSSFVFAVLPINLNLSTMHAYGNSQTNRNWYVDIYNVIDQTRLKCSVAMFFVRHAWADLNTLDMEHLPTRN